MRRKATPPPSHRASRLPRPEHTEESPGQPDAGTYAAPSTPQLDALDALETRGEFPDAGIAMMAALAVELRQAVEVAKGIVDRHSSLPELELDLHFLQFLCQCVEEGQPVGLSEARRTLQRLHAADLTGVYPHE